MSADNPFNGKSAESKGESSRQAHLEAYESMLSKDMSQFSKPGQNSSQRLQDAYNAYSDTMKKWPEIQDVVKNGSVADIQSLLTANEAAIKQLHQSLPHNRTQLESALDQVDLSIKDRLPNVHFEGH